MAYASENPVFSDNNGKAYGHYKKVDYRDAEPIKFMERGIEFYVFPTGEFDFNTRPDDSHGDDFYFRAAGRRGTVIVEKHKPVNIGVRIERDAFGRVRRVGNTFINYDAYDRVNRIGTVFMRYNSFALSQIGNLRIVYDRKGRIVDMFGAVKGYRTGDSCDAPRGGYYEQPRGNDDDYYYRKDKKYEDREDDSNDDQYYYRKNEKTDDDKSSGRR